MDEATAYRNVSQRDAGMRINSLDIIRVLACFMVIMIHCRAGFYFYDPTAGYDYGNVFYCSVLRPCVPFFIMLSGALLLPMRQETGAFFKRRFSRVLIPFLVWSVIYVFLPVPGKGMVEPAANVFAPSVASGDFPLYLYNLVMIPINFTDSNVHFWFIFVILGLYLFIPVISPWVERSGKRTIQFFLAVWVFTLCAPYIQIWFTELHGVCDWNSYGMTYYFAGYIGYLLLGYYLVRYPLASTQKALCLGGILFAVGLTATVLGLAYSGKHLTELQVLAATVTEAPRPELYTPLKLSKVTEFFIDNLTINVGMMTAGLFMILQRVRLPQRIQGVFTRLSKLSYGIFLVHFVVALWLTFWFRQTVFADASAACQSAWLQMPLRALCVFVISWMITELLARLPKSKYLIG